MKALEKPCSIKAKPAGKRVMIIGATSGIGAELARYYLAQDCIVGVSGRRMEKLTELKSQFPKNCIPRRMDVQEPACIDDFDKLIVEMGGLDQVIYCAGVGTQNPELELDIELSAAHTNVSGYIRIATRAYNYFKKQRSGHLVVISSLAGLRALRQSPAYSSTKRFQIQYTSCLAQKANKEKLPIDFTTILPGFIRTDMLKYKYPFAISLEKGARLIYHKIEKRRRYSIVPGRWKWINAVWQLIPNFLWERYW